MVRVGNDLIVLGGNSNPLQLSGCSDSLFRLSCTNNTCKWQELAQKLESAKSGFVAIPVPDDFVTCDDP